MVAKFKFRWGKFQIRKRIEPQENPRFTALQCVKLAGEDLTRTNGTKKILQFINDLKTSGKLTDYNQIAFLFNSVKHPRVTALARFLEEEPYQCLPHRVPDMFFQRDEIRLALGCLKPTDVFHSMCRVEKTVSIPFYSQAPDLLMELYHAGE